MLNLFAFFGKFWIPWNCVKAGQLVFHENKVVQGKLYTVGPGSEAVQTITVLTVYGHCWFLYRYRRNSMLIALLALAFINS